MTREEIVDSAKRCIHLSKEGVPEERCSGCPMRRGEYEESGVAACGPFENLSVDVPYELMQLMIELIEGHKKDRQEERRKLKRTRQQKF